MATTRFVSIDDLNNMPVPEWLIEDLFERTSLIMLAGPSYSFKSFLLLDWLLCMAAGRSWLGKKTSPSKVGYALGEGKASLIKRIRAWMNYNDLTSEELARLKENFKVTFSVPQLASKASVDNMLSDLKEENFAPDVIAIDTFARSFVGLDENDAKDAGLWVEQADRLRQLGYSVIFLHHTKKNTELGVSYRGSTAIMGAMDTAMTLVRDKAYCTLTVTKQKDHDEGNPMRFRRVLVPIDKKESSCVLVSAPQTDERFAGPEEAEAFVSDVEETIDALIADGSYPSDVERARELLTLYPKFTLAAAQMKISRRKERL